LPFAPKKLELVEVGPRDGLQNESVPISTANKVALIERLIGAGLRRIEVVSFVHPERVPQMADAEAVMASLPHRNDVTYIGLVLNKRGALRALESRVNQLGTVAVASDTFGLRNQNQTIAESVESAAAIMRIAREHGRSAQTSISMAFGCPFEGPVSIPSVVRIAIQLAQSEPAEIALADTIGAAVPCQVSELVCRVREAVAPIPVRVHFHNTRNTAIANVWAAINAGATIVDASVGGLGGCPFAPNASGNVATEDVAYLLHRSGIATGVDLQELIQTSRWCSTLLGRPLPGSVSCAGDFPHTPLKEELQS
jgi:hydroxymethylglutaryl-CoA lyase